MKNWLWSPEYKSLMERSPFILGFILLIGFLLRINGLAERSLWTDEFFTFFQATGHGNIQVMLDKNSRSKQPEKFKASAFKAFMKNDTSKGIGDVVDGLNKEDTHPPLYFILMHFWMLWCGDSIFSVRMFSVLAGIVSILLAYKLTGVLFCRSAAYFSAVFLAVCPYAVRYSQEARSYSLVLLLGLLSCFFAIKFEKEKKASFLVLSAIINITGIFTHFFFTLIAFSQFLYFTIAHAKNKAQGDSNIRERFSLGFMAVMAVLFVYFMFFRLKNYNFKLVEWAFGFPVTVFSEARLVLTNLAGLIVIPRDKTGLLLQFTATAILIYLLFKGFKTLKENFRKQALFCLLMTLVPILSLYLIDIIQKGILLRQERFAMFSFLGLIPLIGFVLSTIGKKQGYLFPVFLGIILTGTFLNSKAVSLPAPKEVSRWINSEATGLESTVVVAAIRSVVVAQSYYLDDHLAVLPVAGPEQLKNALSGNCSQVERLFLVRHFNVSDPSLMDYSFLNADMITAPFRFKKKIYRDNISVEEYIR